MDDIVRAGLFYKTHFVGFFDGMKDLATLIQEAIRNDVYMEVDDDLDYAGFRIAFMTDFSKVKEKQVKELADALLEDFV